MKREHLKNKFKSVQYFVVEIDDHNITQLKKSFGSPPSHKNRPTAIFVNTMKEYGISYKEDGHWHYKFQQMRNTNIIINKAYVIKNGKDILLLLLTRSFRFVLMLLKNTQNMKLC